MVDDVLTLMLKLQPQMHTMTIGIAFVNLLGKGNCPRCRSTAEDPKRALVNIVREFSKFLNQFSLQLSLQL